MIARGGAELLAPDFPAVDEDENADSHNWTAGRYLTRMCALSWEKTARSSGGAARS